MAEAHGQPSSPVSQAPNTVSDFNDSTIPNSHKSRIIVLFFDQITPDSDDLYGTVVEFLSLLVKDRPQLQLVYSPSRTQRQIKKRVMEAYYFLMEKYEQGDKICLFGSGKSAYVARVFAAMLYKVGLLGRDQEEKFDFAYSAYMGMDQKSLGHSSTLKKTFSSEVSVQFMGLWNTIRIGTKELPLARDPGARHFCHAVALDSRSVMQVPYLFRKEPTIPEEPCRDAQEVWFAGNHADICRDGTKGLARIALFWMVRQCFLANSGVLFDRNKLERADFPAELLYPHVHPFPEDDSTASASEKALQALEISDSKAKENPESQESDDSDGSSGKSVGIPRVLFRMIPGVKRNLQTIEELLMIEKDKKIKVHYTVEERMKNSQSYQPGSVLDNLKRPQDSKPKFSDDVEWIKWTT